LKVQLCTICTAKDWLAFQGQEVQGQGQGQGRRVDNGETGNAP